MSRCENHIKKEQAKQETQRKENSGSIILGASTLGTLEAQANDLSLGSNQLRGYCHSPIVSGGSRMSKVHYFSIFKLRSVPVSPPALIMSIRQDKCEAVNRAEVPCRDLQNQGKDGPHWQGNGAASRCKRGARESHASAHGELVQSQWGNLARGTGRNGTRANRSQGTACCQTALPRSF